MIWGFLLRQWLPLLVLGVAVGLGTYAYSAIYEAGQRSRDAEVDEIKAEVIEWKMAYGAHEIALKAIRAELSKRDEADAKLAKAAEQAVKDAQAKERDASRSLDYALKQLREASRKPACKALLDMDLRACAT